MKSITLLFKWAWLVIKGLKTHVNWYISILGVLIIILGLRSQDHFLQNVSLNLGAGFFGTGILSSMIAKLIEFEAEAHEKKWLDRLEVILKNSVLSERDRIGKTAKELIREKGLSIPQNEIRTTVKSSWFDVSHVNPDNRNTRQVIGKYVMEKRGSSSEKKLKWGINSMLLTANPQLLDQIVNDLLYHIKTKGSEHKIESLPFSGIVTPKNGNPVLASALASKLNVPIIFYNETDKYNAEHFEGDFELRKTFIIFHDIIETGKRVLDLEHKIRGKGHSVDHIFALVERTDIQIEKLYGNGSNRRINIHPLFQFDDIALENLKKTGRKFPRRR